MNPDAERTEVGRPAGIGIAPGDHDTAATRNQRESAHPGPRDSHEMDRTMIRGVEQVHDGWS
jgi:hypothetical protein